MRPLSRLSAIGLTAAVAIATAALGLAVPWPAAAADAVLLNQVPTAQEFIDALSPREQPAPAIRTRGISKQSPTAPAPAWSDTAAAAPAVDLPIVTFEFNSADLTPNARATLDNLAIALRSDRLASSAFVIEGHTDSVGSDEYNQSLSERRAAAVRGYLLREHGIDGGRLQAVGKGKRELLAGYPPSAEIQRRVRIVNAGGRAW